MKINVQKIIEMWDKKKYSSDKRCKELNALLKYYNRIINFTDLGILTINIHATVTNEYKDIIQNI